MSRTVKDERGLPSVQLVYEILRRPDGSFDIFHNAELTDKSVPNAWLEEQLVKYGICGKEYRDARKELDELGVVRLVYSTGRVRTKLKIGSHS